ncbi:MAG: sigma-70 family RNA polymerase sigma factor [Pirellulaceae bacterium]|nr:sigma-70 family RNA polymerase sigma factor [Pirellulaceae bacterium]MDP7014750.1 sigma-70 family RNA polymerase sigma factor [Pirellulaceae bacterium]
MSEPNEADQLLALARDGDDDAWGELLERYRPYLRFLARRGMDVRLQARVDASDVVQQTFLEAARDLSKFRGSVERELIAWLRTILEHNVAETIQVHLATKKRSARRERSLDDSNDGGIPLRNQTPDDQSTPSQRVMRGEAAVILARAVEKLPPDQCEAIRLRHFEGYSLKELAEHFQRSETAVAGLLKRGLQKLRDLLAHRAESTDR